jgi:hypothetical protein
MLKALRSWWNGASHTTPDQATLRKELPFVFDEKGIPIAPAASAAIVIEPMPSLREGIPFRFRGAAPDAQDQPTGQFIDVELVVPPLNFDSLRTLQDKLKAWGTEPSTESLSTLCDALGHALRRNYRNVPLWLIAQSIDVENMAALMQALMDISGLRRKAYEEGKARAAEAAKSIGTASTAT